MRSPEGVTDISRQFARRDMSFHVIEKLAECDFDPGQKMIAFVVIPITEVKFSIKENKVEVKMFEVLTSVRLFP